MRDQVKHFELVPLVLARIIFFVKYCESYMYDNENLNIYQTTKKLNIAMKIIPL